MIVAAGALSHHQRRGPNAPVRRTSAMKALGLAFAGWATVKALRSATDGSPARTRRGRLPEPPPARPAVAPVDPASRSFEPRRVGRAKIGGDAITRSEEELLVERTFRPHERVRLVKRVVTESITQTVELRREELRVERETLDEGERGGALGARAQPLEIVLHEEQVLIEKRVVPRERVRVTKQLITEQRPLSAELRREKIVLEQNLPPANAITTERQ